MNSNLRSGPKVILDRLTVDSITTLKNEFTSPFDALLVGLAVDTQFGIVLTIFV